MVKYLDPNFYICLCCVAVLFLVFCSSLEFWRVWLLYVDLVKCFLVFWLACLFVCLFVCFAVKRHHDQSNSYKGKHLVGAAWAFWRFSFIILIMGSMSSFMQSWCWKSQHLYILVKGKSNIHSSSPFCTLLLMAGTGTGPLGFVTSFTA